MNLQRPRQAQQQNSAREKYEKSQYQHDIQGYQPDSMINQIPLPYYLQQHKFTFTKILTYKF